MRGLTKALGAIAICASFAAGGAAAHDQLASAAGASVVKVLAGPASWYGGKFHGRLTANGERFDKWGLTAAHRTLPFGTKVRVTNERNGRSVVVRINDRGPFHGNRVIDLSRGAAEEVGLVNSGTAPVKIEVLGRA